MTKEFVTNFQKNYDRTVNYFGFGDKSQLLIPLASKYTIENKQFSGVILSKIVQQINESIKVRNDNYLLDYKIAALLLSEGNVEESIIQLKEKVKALKEVGFKNSIYRVLGGISLENDYYQHARRAKTLFDELKRNQRLLTTKEDIPYVVYLTTDETQNPTLQANTVIRYYQQLKQLGFSMGNHLQALSFIMTLYSEDYHEMLLEYVVQLRKELEKKNIKIKRIHYPYLGILALSKTDNQKIEEISNLYFMLIEEKPLRSAKNQALIVAIQKAVQECTDVPNVNTVSRLKNLFDITDFYIDLLSLDIGDILDFLN